MEALQLSARPLSDIREVEPFGPKDQACFDEVRDVLARHGMLSRFGVTLLHRHFEVGNDEVLVERIDVEKRILQTTPVPRDEVGDAIQTSWRFDDSVIGQMCETQCQPDRDAQGNPIHMRPHYTI